jgi:hypothetical protein
VTNALAGEVSAILLVVILGLFYWWWRNRRPFNVDAIPNLIPNIPNPMPNVSNLTPNISNLIPNTPNLDQVVRNIDPDGQMQQYRDTLLSRQPSSGEREPRGKDGRADAGSATTPEEGEEDVEQHLDGERKRQHHGSQAHVGHSKSGAGSVKATSGSHDVATSSGGASAHPTSGHAQNSSHGSGSHHKSQRHRRPSSKEREPRGKLGRADARPATLPEEGEEDVKQHPDGGRTQQTHDSQAHVGHRKSGASSVKATSGSHDVATSSGGAPAHTTSGHAQSSSTHEAHPHRRLSPKEHEPRHEHGRADTRPATTPEESEEDVKQHPDEGPTQQHHDSQAYVGRRKSGASGGGASTRPTSRHAQRSSQGSGLHYGPGDTESATAAEEGQVNVIQHRDGRRVTVTVSVDIPSSSDLVVSGSPM